MKQVIIEIGFILLLLVVNGIFAMTEKASPWGHDPIHNGV
jgi:hypothetical protein